jgi:hypothetical protein
MGLYGFETAKDRENFLKQFDLDEKAKWLRERRNTLVHRKGSQIETVSLEEVINYREKLRYDAKAAVAYALRISFLPSKYPEVFNKYL